MIRGEISPESTNAAIGSVSIDGIDITRRETVTLTTISRVSATIAPVEEGVTYQLVLLNTAQAVALVLGTFDAAGHLDANVDASSLPYGTYSLSLITL